MTRLKWPTFDPAMLEQDEVLIVVQVNGKKRAEITVPVDLPEEQIKTTALAESNVKKFVEGKTVRKMVIVPGKLLNIVVG